MTERARWSRRARSAIVFALCAGAGASIGAVSAARASRCPIPTTVATLEHEATTIDGVPVEPDVADEVWLRVEGTSARLSEVRGSEVRDVSLVGPVEEP